jgi:predicted DNA-binding protein (MmcQ/YjbR family)
MNKAYWVSIYLDGTVEREKIEWLLNLSFDLTKKLNKNARK